MAFKTSKYRTLTAATEAVVDLAELGNAALWPAQITIINRGVTIGATESANAAAEIGVAVERFVGAASVGSEQTAAFPLAAVATDGAFIVPARIGASTVIQVNAFSDNSNLKVHLWSSGASLVAIIAEG